MNIQYEIHSEAQMPAENLPAALFTPIVFNEEMLEALQQHHTDERASIVPVGFLIPISQIEGAKAFHKLLEYTLYHVNEEYYIDMAIVDHTIFNRELEFTYLYFAFGATTRDPLEMITALSGSIDQTISLASALESPLKMPNPFPAFLEEQLAIGESNA